MDGCIDLTFDNQRLMVLNQLCDIVTLVDEVDSNFEIAPTKNGRFRNLYGDFTGTGFETPVTEKKVENGIEFGGFDVPSHVIPNPSKLVAAFMELLIERREDPLTVRAGDSSKDEVMHDAGTLVDDSAEMPVDSDYETEYDPGLKAIKDFGFLDSLMDQLVISTSEVSEVDITNVMVASIPKAKPKHKKETEIVGSPTLTSTKMNASKQERTIIKPNSKKQNKKSTDKLVKHQIQNGASVNQIAISDVLDNSGLEKLKHTSSKVKSKSPGKKSSKSKKRGISEL